MSHIPSYFTSSSIRTTIGSELLHYLFIQLDDPFRPSRVQIDADIVVHICCSAWRISLRAMWYDQVEKIEAVLKRGDEKLNGEMEVGV